MDEYLKRPVVLFLYCGMLPRRVPCVWWNVQIVDAWVVCMKEVCFPRMHKFLSYLPGQNMCTLCVLVERSLTEM